MTLFNSVENAGSLKVGDVVMMGGDAYNYNLSMSYAELKGRMEREACQVGKVIGFTPSGRVNVEVIGGNGEPFKMQFYRPSYGWRLIEYGGRMNRTLMTPQSSKAAEWFSQAIEELRAERKAANEKRMAEAKAENARLKTAEEIQFAAMQAVNGKHLIRTASDADLTRYITTTDRQGIDRTVFFFTAEAEGYDWTAGASYPALTVKFTYRHRDAFDLNAGRPGDWRTGEVMVRNAGHDWGQTERNIRDGIAWKLW